MTRERFQLSDKERHDIRWSQSKRGFVVLTEFARGRRGARFRPVRSEAFSSLTKAVEYADKEPTRYRQQTAAVTLFEVDAMGRVLDEVAA